MDPGGHATNTIDTLTARSRELVAALRLQSTEEAEQCRKDLEQFGDEATTLIEQVAALVTAELSEGHAAERAAFEQHRSEWEAVRDQVETELAARECDLESLPELQKKFDMALADLHRFREHTARLEEELATRPEHDDSESAELVQLRGERDALMDRLDELSAQMLCPSEPADVADLRERFEGAVEEVRQLKRENEGLLQKREARPPAEALAPDENNNWEAQKRRLLAQLEGEGEAGDGEREQERAQIAGTIQITDSVVQQKDDEISRLEQQLAELALVPDKEPDAAEVALLDEDSVIQAERERLAQLEAECEEKLRSAELELSVERAKIARAQSELASHQLELEALRAACSPNENEGVAHDNRHQWLRKLGLGDEN